METLMGKTGYQADFLGNEFKVELPTVTPQFDHEIFKSNDLNNNIVIDYLNYSIVMNKTTRQAFFSAANADFSQNTGKGRNFRLDGRVDKYQLDNIYYKDIDSVENPYDRGHLTRRDAISWGKNDKQANKASKDSCYYTNISLQHKNFNQDEWAALEIAIEKTNNDLDNRFNIVTGPIFTNLDRYLTPQTSMKAARIPSAFWKVITYIGKKSKVLETNAFIVYQDEFSISAMKQVKYNKEVKPFKYYQTSTTLIEELTGLEFPDACFDRNPLYFFESETTKEKKIVTPQLKEIHIKNAENEIIFEQ